MNYCVLIKFSKELISVWYKLQSEKYAPFNWNNSNDVPLYFHVNGNNFEFGNVAREKFYSNDPDAYGNYFEITEDPTNYFIIQGNKKPVKQILYCGIEQLLSRFLNTVLYKHDSIESYRHEFPLRFVFERDIEDKEKLLVENLFRDAGYNNIERISFNEYFLLMLDKMHIVPHKNSVLLLKSVDNTLYMDLYKDITEPYQVVEFSKLENEGSDPRVLILADKILDYILVQNSFLNVEKSKETRALLPLAEDLLERNLPIHKGTTFLMNCTGGPYYFSVRQSEINDAMQFNSNDFNITSAIDDVLKKSGFKASNTYIILGSRKINTLYFANRLLKKYQHVVSIDSANISQVLSFIFDNIESLEYEPTNSYPIAPPFITVPKLPPKLKETLISSPVPSVNMPPPIPSVAVMKKPNPSLILSKPALPPIPPQQPNNMTSVIKQPPLPPKKLIP